MRKILLISIYVPILSINFILFFLLVLILPFHVCDLYLVLLFILLDLSHYLYSNLSNKTFLLKLMNLFLWNYLSHSFCCPFRLVIVLLKRSSFFACSTQFSYVNCSRSEEHRIMSLFRLHLANLLSLTQRKWYHFEE